MFFVHKFTQFSKKKTANPAQRTPNRMCLVKKKKKNLFSKSCYDRNTINGLLVVEVKNCKLHLFTSKSIDTAKSDALNVLGSHSPANGR